MAALPLLHKLRHTGLLWRLLGAPLEHNEEHGEREQGRAHEGAALANGRLDQLDEQISHYFDRLLALRMMRREQEITRMLLCWAVNEGRAQTVEWLLSEGGADAHTKDGDGDPVLHIAVSHADLRTIHILIDAGADVEVRDRDGATPLVLACMKGHTSCTDALLSVGARVDSKWQFLQPIQWAREYGHTSCVELCKAFGATLHAVPHGRGRSAITSSLAENWSARTNENRLRPPCSQVKRRRRKARAGSLVAHWEGLAWVGRSLLAAVEEERRRCGGYGKSPLVQRHADLGWLHRALAKHLKGNENAGLPAETVASVSLRPGVRFRRAQGDHCHRILAAPTANASLFGQPGVAPHFVDVAHEFDPTYKHFFGELRLCFTCSHEGKVHELCLIKWLWPIWGPGTSGLKDGVPLSTVYEFPPKSTYEVKEVGALLYRAPLFSPPSFRRQPTTLRYLLCEDIYTRF